MGDSEGSRTTLDDATYQKKTNQHEVGLLFGI